MLTNLALAREAEAQVEANPLQEEEVGEREYMFEKVVTPSDVGKLNRLVIPKQYAERYFPLESSSTQKGLLLNFEDLSGKSWRFRYSYWNSSQSYVMTKGWSRFVKDKMLHAGDVVSFHRCVGDSGIDSRLFIDWKRRPKVPDNPTRFDTRAMYPRLYSFPTTSSQSYDLYNHHMSSYYNYPQIPRDFGYGYFVRSLDQRNYAAVSDPLVMMHGGAQAHQAVVRMAGKRLRLFGVDIECGASVITEEESSSSGAGGDGGASSSSPSTLSLCQLRLGSSSDDNHFSKKRKSSLSIDLDL